jgi:hypothetical protein
MKFRRNKSENNHQDKLLKLEASAVCRVLAFRHTKVQEQAGLTTKRA